MECSLQRLGRALATVGALVFFLMPCAVRAQGSMDYAVHLSALVQEDPASITLVWPEAFAQNTNDYAIFRRTPGAGPWGDALATGGDIAVLDDGRRAFTDTSVEIGRAYEYKVTLKLRIASANGQRHMAYGYIVSGIRVPLVENRGTVILVIERSLTDLLGAELARLQNDLIGDGWRVTRLEVGRDDNPVDVKSRIKEICDADPKSVKAAFLLGRVPVPYSGNFQPLAPDGHSEHRGAWPADVYYANLNGEWTDQTQRFINPASERATNTPGDGKFDQSYLPSDAELQIGRVDLSSMPGAGAAKAWPEELALLKAYLDKDHDFRTGRMAVRRKALVSETWDANGGRAYAASGYRNFAPIVGPENVVVANTSLETSREERWLRRLEADSYLWVFGFGGGSNTSMSGLGEIGEYNDVRSIDLVDGGAKGVFHLFFGSWFGDWDQPDNLMRATLVTKYGLACAWSGRPHLVFHPMAMGETLGAGIRASQNNLDTYDNQTNSFRRGTHIALLGDPTLRLYPVPTPEVRATVNGNDVVLTWKSSVSDLVGYHVYRSDASGTNFTRLTDTPTSDTSFIDSGRAADRAIYMVRVITLEKTASGSFYNASVGALANPVTMAEAAPAPDSEPPPEP